MNGTGSRRGAALWGDPASQCGAAEPAPQLEILIPTVGREAELAVTLAGLAAQDDPPFAVIVSDQSPDGVEQYPAVRAMQRVLRAQGRPVTVHRHLPRRGMAEQRQFLLDQSSAARVLYLDDDVWLEPGALQRLDAALTECACGFVGYAVQGLSYLDDVRPEETSVFEAWQGNKVRPEQLRPGTPEMRRASLHNAANPTHLARQQQLNHDSIVAYRVAWIGACTMFDRRSLVASGGFSFWPLLPHEHAGEDRVAQWCVMERYGGAGILPSAAVHLEAPTTVTDRRVEASDVVFPCERGAQTHTPEESHVSLAPNRRLTSSHTRTQ